MSDSAMDAFELDLRAIDMPYPPHEPNPELATITEEMYAWADEYALLSHPVLRRNAYVGRSDLAAAVYYPTAEPARLLHIAQYLVWAFSIDDTLDDAIAGHGPADVFDLVAELIRSIDECADSAKPFTRAGYDLHERFRTALSPHWFTRMRDEGAAWLCTYVTEAVATRVGRRMTLGEYLPHRRYSVNLITFLLLVEYSLNIDIPDRVRQLPAMIDAREAASEWIGLCNDIHSVKKEADVDYHYNAVLIIAAQREQTKREAMSAVTTKLNELLARFEAALARVPKELKSIDTQPNNPHHIDQLAQGYRRIIRASFDFHIDHPRYHDTADTTTAPARQN